MSVKINTENVAVDQTYFWQPMESCPQGAKVQLLTTTGVAVYGNGTRNNISYLAWAPLPKRPLWLIERKPDDRPSVEPHGY